MQSLCDKSLHITPSSTHHSHHMLLNVNVLSSHTSSIAKIDAFNQAVGKKKRNGSRMGDFSFNQNRNRNKKRFCDFFSFSLSVLALSKNFAHCAIH